MLKKLLMIIGAVVLVFWLVSQLGITSAQQAPVDVPTETEYVDPCPEGSYNIGESKQDGEVICKLEPTGCPYGDSIPLGPDCDKHAPQPTGTTADSDKGEVKSDATEVVDYSDIQGK